MDNEAAVENLKRMAQKKGAAADVKADGSSWIVEIVPAGAPAAQSGAGLSGAVATGGVQSGAALSGGAQSGAALSNGAQSSLSAEEQAQQICAVPARGPVVVAIGSAEMGNGDPKLGKILMKSFLYSLTSTAACA